MAGASEQVGPRRDFDREAAALTWSGHPRHWFQDLKKDRLRLSGAILVLLAAVLWGTTGTAQALAPSTADPLTIGALRMAVGATGLLTFWGGRRLASGRSSIPTAGGHETPDPGSKPGWPLAPTILSAMAMAAYQPLFFTAVGRTGVAIGTVVTIGSAPLLTGLIYAIIGRQRLERAWILATPVSILGLLLLFAAGQELAVNRAGILLALAAGLSYALFTLASAEILKSHPPETVMALVFTLAAVLLMPLILRAELGWLKVSSGWLAVAHLGLLATALAYTLFARGLRLIPAPSAATLSLAEPITAALLALAVLGERLPRLSWLGLTLVVMGLFVLVVTADRSPAGPE